MNIKTALFSSERDVAVHFDPEVKVSLEGRHYPKDLLHVTGILIGNALKNKHGVLGGKVVVLEESDDNIRVSQIIEALDISTPEYLRFGDRGIYFYVNSDSVPSKQLEDMGQASYNSIEITNIDGVCAISREGWWTEANIKMILERDSEISTETGFSDDAIEFEMHKDRLSLKLPINSIDQEHIKSSPTKYHKLPYIKADFYVVFDKLGRPEFFIPESMQLDWRSPNSSNYNLRAFGKRFYSFFFGDSEDLTTNMMEDSFPSFSVNRIYKDYNNENPLVGLFDVYDVLGLERDFFGYEDILLAFISRIKVAIGKGRIKMKPFIRNSKKKVSVDAISVPITVSRTLGKVFNAHRGTRSQIMNSEIAELKEFVLDVANSVKIGDY